MPPKRVAFVYAADGINIDNIEVVKQWSGSYSSTSEKTPSQLVYLSEKHLVKWGYEVDPGDASLRYLKLLLDPKHEFPYWTNQAVIKEQLKRVGKTTTSAIADYLTKLLEDAKKAMIARYTQAFLDKTVIEYIITVPELWSDAAKHETLQAARSAGCPREHTAIVPEPEAAAAYALSTQRGALLTQGDVVILCDCGGGTVDLTTYTIQDLRPVRLQQFVVSAGGLCGGAFINQAFETLLETRLTSTTFASICAKRPYVLSTILAYFENHVKHKFNPEEHEDQHEHYAIPVAGLKDNVCARIQDGFMAFSTQELRQIFDPIISQVLDLIQLQYNAARMAGNCPKAVIMVGGFSQSGYLLRCIKKRFAEHSNEHSSDHKNDLMEVITSLHTWTAVLRGAVLRGLPHTGDKIISSRIAKLHYGVTVDPDWKAGVHSEESKYFDEIMQRDRAHNVMQWLVRRDQTIKNNHRFIHNYDLGMRNIPELHEETLYICTSEVPPSELNDEVKPLCTLQIPCAKSVLGRNAWRQRYTVVEGQGPEVYWQMNFDLSIVIKAANLAFSFTTHRSNPISVEAEFK